MGDIFDTIGAAKATGGGEYIRDGKYEFIVNSLKLEDLYAGRTFIAELYVKASAPSGEVDEQGKTIKPNAVGSLVSYIQQLDKFKETAPGNVKGFVEKLTGTAYGNDPESIAKFKKDMMKAISDKQPLRGAEIKATTYRKPIQKGANKGKLLTLPKWTTVEQTKENVLANQAILDNVASAAQEVAEEETAAEEGVA